VTDDRRSPRLLLDVPLALDEDGLSIRAHTAVVSRGGALVLAPHYFAPDTLLRAANLETGGTALCRVVWCGGQEQPGLYKLGLEIVRERSGAFWGRVYEDAAGEDPLAAVSEVSLRDVSPAPTRRRVG
jgi:hypothetical protein